MRLWIAIVLALSVFLAPLAVAGPAVAMVMPGCADKTAHSCPCDHAPKSCQDMCASPASQIGIALAPFPVAAMTVEGADHFLKEPLVPDEIARGLDPPVPRA